MTIQAPLRKLFHFSGSAIPLAYLVLGRPLLLAVTIVLFLSEIALEILRMRGGLKYGFLQGQLKKEEAIGFTGSFYFLLSCLLTILLFRKSVAVPAMLILSIADPLSSLVGQACARKPLFGKSIQGTAAFFLASLAILLCFPLKGYAVPAAALAATLAELFSSRLVDDNLTIPLVTAATLTLLS